MIKAIQRKLPLIVILLIGMLYANSARSIERCWTNVIGNNLWNEPLNWIPIGVPESVDSVNTFYGEVLIIPYGHTASIKYFKNLGNLTIETGAQLIINDGYFNCNGVVMNRGTIVINNSPTYGLKHSSFQANSQPITNEGSIFINNSALAGLWIRYDQTFTNEVGGIVEITNSGEASLELNGTFSNRGLLKTQGSLIETAILMKDVESSFTNSKCASVHVQDKIDITEGLFSNLGFLRQNYNGINGLSYLHTYFVNYGLLEDHSNSFLESHFENLGIWIGTYENPILEGDSISIFLNQYPLDASISEVYLEKELITSAGLYDYNSNIWIPNSNAVGNSSFYVEVTQDYGNCQDTVKFNTTEAVTGVNFWIGGVGDWQLGANWNYGTVPTALDNVAIYGNADVVTMPINYQAFANNVLVKGKLNIALLSKLTINESHEENGLEIQKGIVVNNGTIELKNTQTGIFIYGGFLENNGTINCTGTSQCLKIISYSGINGEFINNSNAIATSDTAQFISAFYSKIKNYGIFDAQIDGESSAMSGDSLYNYGTINIKGININSGAGLSMDFINFDSGVINISKMEEGIVGSGENHGNIFIDSCSVGLIILGGNLINENNGIINIDQCKEGFNTGFRDFFNNPGAQVAINKADLGIKINENSNLHNQGLIKIDSCFTYGIHCYGHMYNELSAQTIIDRGIINGLFLEENKANFYGRDQSILEISGYNEDEILIDKADLWLEDNAIIKIKSN